jgi:hypothetical protein
VSEGAKRKGRGPGRPFAPGNPGGPGKPPTPPELKEAKRLTKTEFERLANRFLWATQAELAAYHADPSLTSVERLIISILMAGTDEGDQARAEWFLNRLLGKVTDKVEVRTPTPFVVVRRDGTALELGSAPPKDED